VRGLSRGIRTGLINTSILNRLFGSKVQSEGTDCDARDNAYAS
jgi:hypothetical protein